MGSTFRSLLYFPNGGELHALRNCRMLKLPQTQEVRETPYLSKA